MRILIVEDDKVSRLVLGASLRKLGHIVLVACDGEEAMRIYEQEKIPLVICDWMMPNMDGLELCRRIRGSGRERYTYVIFVTALDGKRNYLDAMEAGADDFLTKPYDPAVLQARLRVAQRILSLQAEVRQLEGLLPICAYCRKIRDEQTDSWSTIESYLSAKTEASFSHGVCPGCYETKLKPEVEAWKLQHC